MHGNRKDLTGQRFGRLVVIEPVTTGEYRNSVWLCQCDCGNKKIVPTYRLLNGRTFSCGCYRKQAKQVIEELAKVKTENERLKSENDGLKSQLDFEIQKRETVEAEKERLNRLTGIYSFRQMEKYKQALEEVRDCINVLSTVDNDFKGSMVEWKINKIINEVLNENH